MDRLLAPLIARGSPFELETLEDDRRIFRHAPATLGSLFIRERNRSPDAVFIVSNNQRVTRRRLFMMADALELELKARKSVGNQVRIGILLPDSIAWLVAFVATTNMGATAVLIPPSKDVRATIAAIEQAECQWIITDAGAINCISHGISAAVLTLAVLGTGPSIRANWLAREPERADTSAWVAPRADSEALIAFTSGTTGQAKGAILTHRNVLTGLWNMMLGGAWASRRASASSQARPVKPGGVPCCLVLSPLSHISGYAQFLLMLVVAGRIVFRSEWNIRQLIDLIQAEHVKAIVGATAAMTLDLIRSVGPTEDALPLETFSIHGVALRRRWLDQIREKYPNASIITGYGMTETSGSIAIARGSEVEPCQGACGPVLPTVDVQIRDDNGDALANRTPGEIWVRGSAVSQQYCGHRSLPGGMTASGSWFRTGDVGSLDANGNLTVLQRSRDVLHIGDRMVRCIDVEKLLDAWNVVEESVTLVAGRSRDRLLVVMVPKDGARKNVEAEMIRGRLCEAFSIDSGAMSVVWVESLPRTSSGKVDRQALIDRVVTEELYEDGLA